MQKKILFLFIICFSFESNSQVKQITSHYKPHVINNDWIKVQSDYHYLVGEMKSLNHEGEESIQHFRESLVYALHSKETLQFRLAQEYLKQRMHHKAHKISSRLIQNSTNTSFLVRVSLLLAEIYTSINLLKVAVDQYDVILALDDQNKQALINQTLLRAELKEGRSYDKTILIEEPQFHFHMGDVYRSFGKIEQASKSYKQALILDSSYRLAAWNLFKIYGQQQKYTQWLAFMKEHPSQDMFITALQAQAHLKLGEKTRFFEKVVDLLLDHPSSSSLKAELALNNYSIDLLKNSKL